MANALSNLAKSMLPKKTEIAKSKYEELHSALIKGGNEERNVRLPHKYIPDSQELGVDEEIARHVYPPHKRGEYPDPKPEYLDEYGDFGGDKYDELERSIRDKLEADYIKSNYPEYADPTDLYHAHPTEQAAAFESALKRLGIEYVPNESSSSASKYFYVKNPITGKEEKIRFATHEKQSKMADDAFLNVNSEGGNFSHDWNDAMDYLYKLHDAKAIVPKKTEFELGNSANILAGGALGAIGLGAMMPDEAQASEMPVQGNALSAVANRPVSRPVIHAPLTREERLNAEYGHTPMQPSYKPRNIFEKVMMDAERKRKLKEDWKVAQGKLPADIAYGEEPLQAPNVAGISIDPTDYLGPGALKAAGVGLKSLPMLVGGASIYGMPKGQNMAKLIREAQAQIDAENAARNAIKYKIQDNRVRNALVGIGAGGAGMAGGYYGADYLSK